MRNFYLTNRPLFCAVAIFLVLFTVGALPVTTFAQLDEPLVEPCNQQVDAEGNFTNPCDFDVFVANMGRIINWLLAFAVTVAAVLFAYAGILYVTAAGDEKKIQKAHSVFRFTITGFILALIAWLVVNTIVTTFVSDPDSYTLLGS